MELKETKMSKKTLLIEVEELKKAKEYFKEFIRPLGHIVYLVGIKAPEISPNGLTLDQKSQEDLQAQINKNFGLMVMQDADFPNCSVKKEEFVHIKANTEAVISKVFISDDKWNIVLPEHNTDKMLIDNPQKRKAEEALKKKYIFLGIEYFNLTTVIEPRNIEF